MKLSLPDVVPVHPRYIKLMLEATLEHRRAINARKVECELKPAQIGEAAIDYLHTPAVQGLKPAQNSMRLSVHITRDQTCTLMAPRNIPGTSRYCKKLGQPTYDQCRICNAHGWAVVSVLEVHGWKQATNDNMWSGDYVKKRPDPYSYGTPPVHSRYIKLLQEARPTFP